MEPNIEKVQAQKKRQTRDITQQPVAKVVKASLGVFRKCRVMLDTADLNGLNPMEKLFAKDDLELLQREHDALGKVLSRIRKVLETP